MEATSGELTVLVFDARENVEWRNMVFELLAGLADDKAPCPSAWQELLEGAGWWDDRFATCHDCGAVVDTHPMAGDWNVVNGLCDLCVPDELQELREIESDDETVNDLRMMAEECPDGAAAVLLQVRALMEGSGN
jgi:hypothetical protein